MNHITTTPLPWVQRYAGLIPQGSDVLDVACGSGRHSRLLLERGYTPVAVDIDIAGVLDLERDAGVECIEADLENEPWPFANRVFGGIVVANYLFRPHYQELIAALAVNGTLIFDTFAVGNEHYGRPRNPDYLLRPGELLDNFGLALNVKAYANGPVGEPAQAVRQSICGVRED